MHEKHGIGPAIQPGAPNRMEELVVFPLLTAEAADLPYVLLADALEAGTLEITEVGTGTVPTLLAINRGDEDVLVLDGEQLVGAKQNRMTNRSLLLPAWSETRIPVSCIERGRWHSVGRTFRSAPQHSPSGVRRKARSLEARLAAWGADVSAPALAHVQSEVWSVVREQSLSLGVRSQTEALDDLYAARRRDLASWVERFPVEDGQVGVLAFLEGAPLGMDVVGGRAHWARLHDRILRGYCMDALTRRAERDAGRTYEPSDPKVPGHSADPETPGHPAHSDPDEADALRFLAGVHAAVRCEAPTIGKGAYRVLSGTVLGGELVDGDRLPHRCAFPPDERDGWRGPSPDPPARRRT